LRSKNAGGQYGADGHFHARSLRLQCRSVDHVCDRLRILRKPDTPPLHYAAYHDCQTFDTERSKVLADGRLGIACLSSLCSDALVMYPLDPRLQVGTRKPPHCPSREVSYELPALIRTPPTGDRRLLCAVDQSQGLRCELKWRDHHLYGPSVRFMTTGAETADKYEEDVEVGVGCRVHRAVSGPFVRAIQCKKKTTVRGIPMWSPTIVLTSRYTA
jgi:hypothetical protein